jgi:hypothetical protein
MKKNYVTTATNDLEPTTSAMVAVAATRSPEDKNTA